MLYYVDPLMATALISGGIFFVSYTLGKARGEGIHEHTIANTIDHLIDEGYLKTKRLPDGEVELLRVKKPVAK
jgi:hypothetical protein